MRKPRGFVFNVQSHVIEVKLTRECINDCMHSGSCDADVALWVNKLRPYLAAIPAEKIAGCLAAYGAWDKVELQDTEENLHRFLWCAAGDCKEEHTCWTYMEIY